MIFTAIDLEMNKENHECTDIIQVGAVVGNSVSGEILARFSEFIKIDKPLSPYITGLTGIEESDLKKGMSLLEAHAKLKSLHLQYKSHKSVVQWGSGDEALLKKQLLAKGMDISEWEFGKRCFDVKTVCQTMQLSRGETIQGGLKKNCNRFGAKFVGPAHNALNDAESTFNLFHKLIWRLNDR